MDASKWAPSSGSDTLVSTKLRGGRWGNSLRAGRPSRRIFVWYQVDGEHYIPRATRMTDSESEPRARLPKRHGHRGRLRTLGLLADAWRERPTASRETGYTYSTAMSRANAIAPECCINARDGILERNASVGVTRYALGKNPHTPTLRLPTPCRR